MLSFLLWYVLISFCGLLAFPLAFRLLPALADRGYSLVRTLGLLLWGYAFWLLADLGMLPNSRGGLLFALALVAGAGAWTWRGLDREALRAWWRDHRSAVITTEILFLIAFAAWAVVRSANPEASGTEKPMELAFINAILHSPSLPPHDPWLSGYAISYYYFGYVLVAMLAKLTSTGGGVAFNLASALVFALSAAGAYGLLYNLLAHRAQARARRFSLPALLGPFFLLIVSNMEGFLHVLHTRGLFWSVAANGARVSPFWTWLDINDLKDAPALPYSWIPSKFWWWWRASRVLQDYDFTGRPLEIIDEFPFFSYLLGDLHPHVLAMPFAFLAMALALNVFLGGASGWMETFRRRFNLRTLAWGTLLCVAAGLGLIIAGASGSSVRWMALGLLTALLGVIGLLRFGPELMTYGAAVLFRNDLGALELGPALSLSPAAFCLAVICLGGMAFLNTWDFPVYVALFAAAFALRRVWEDGWRWQRLSEFVTLGVLIGILGILAYLPFYAGFSSQAGGLLPNLIYPTRGAHLWVMFGTLLLPIGAFLIYLWRQKGSLEPRSNRPGFAAAFLLVGGGLLALWLLAILLGVGISRLPVLGDLFMGSMNAPGTGALLAEALHRRLVASGGWITLLLFLSVSLGLLLRAWRPARVEDTQDQKPDETPAELETVTAASLPNGADHLPLPAEPDRSHVFILLMIFVGALLVTFPEFFFLRDQFGNRMNTIFKFYFQAWAFWSVAAAYGITVLLSELRGAWSWVYRAGLALLLVTGLAYPVFGLPSKTNGFSNPQGWTLDGSAYYGREAPEEMAAIQWLQNAPAGVIAEAVSPTGGSYTSFARAATFSGHPDVLGWIGHESQWRGGGAEMGSRQADMQRLYCSRDLQEALPILSAYQVRYVFVGFLERSTYGPGSNGCASGLQEAKFKLGLVQVFNQGNVAIYEVPVEGK